MRATLRKIEKIGSTKIVISSYLYSHFLEHHNKASSWMSKELGPGRNLVWVLCFFLTISCCFVYLVTILEELSDSFRRNDTNLYTNIDTVSLIVLKKSLLLCWTNNYWNCHSYPNAWVLHIYRPEHFFLFELDWVFM